MFHGNTSSAKDHRQWSVFLFSCLLSFLLRGKYVDKYLAWELGHSTPWYPKPPSQKLETCSNIDSIGARDFTAFARKEGRKPRRNQQSNNNSCTAKSNTKEASSWKAEGRRFTSRQTMPKRTPSQDEDCASRTRTHDFSLPQISHTHFYDGFRHNKGWIRGYLDASWG